jgi:ABC-type tungstate transport system substrate-binding protein
MVGGSMPLSLPQATRQMLGALERAKRSALETIDVLRIGGISLILFISVDETRGTLEPRSTAFFATAVRRLGADAAGVGGVLAERGVRFAVDSKPAEKSMRGR